MMLSGKILSNVHFYEWVVGGMEMVKLCRQKGLKYHFGAACFCINMIQGGIFFAPKKRHILKHSV